MSWKDGHGDVEYQFQTDTDESVNVKTHNVVIKMKLTDKDNKRTMKIVMKPTHLSISLSDRKIEGDLAHPIKAGDSMWYIESEKNDDRFLFVELARVNEDDRFGRIFLSDPEPEPEPVGNNGNPGMGGMGGMGGGMGGMGGPMGGGGGGGGEGGGMDPAMMWV